MKPFRTRLERNRNERRKEVAHRLKSARLTRKLSQALVAEVLGYSCQADVAKIERGGRTRGGRLLDAIELENFAQLYGLPMDHFETWSTQVKADLSKFGYPNDLAFRQDELKLRLAEAKERRSRERRLKLSLRRRANQ